MLGFFVMWQFVINYSGRMFHPKKIDDIKAGMQASIKREGKHPLGVIKWIGKFPHSSTVQIGIELDEKCKFFIEIILVLHGSCCLC